MNVQVMVEKTEQTNCDVFQKDYGVHHESSESSEHSKLCWRSSSALRMDLSALRAVLRLTASKWATNQRRDPAKSGSDQKISHRGGQNSSWYRISVGILKSQSRTQQGNELLVKLSRGMKWGRSHREGGKTSSIKVPALLRWPGLQQCPGLLTTGIKTLSGSLERPSLWSASARCSRKLTA